MKKGTKIAGKPGYKLVSTPAGKRWTGTGAGGAVPQKPAAPNKPASQKPAAEPKRNPWTPPANPLDYLPPELQKDPKYVNFSHAEEAMYGADVAHLQVEGRTAKCDYCRKEVPSTSKNTPMFKYQGAGSKEADKICKVCHKVEFAHWEYNPVTKRPGITDHTFEPQGDVGHDSYYCGCRGWD